MRQSTAIGHTKRKSPTKRAGMRVRGTSSDGVVSDRGGRHITKAGPIWAIETQRTRVTEWRIATYFQTYAQAEEHLGNQIRLGENNAHGGASYAERIIPAEAYWYAGVEKLSDRFPSVGNRGVVVGTSLASGGSLRWK